MATTINAGRVAMVPKGEWSASTAYTRLDVVLYQGSAWVCIKDGTGQEPAQGSTYWQLLSLKGEQGEKGDKGEQGEKGDKGEQGVGFDSANSPTPADGTWHIKLTNGDTITIDLNHVHQEYLKYELVSVLPASPDSDTLYLIAAE